MRIGIDLLSIKLGKVGGLQTYIDNLLKGFSNLKNTENFKFILYTSKDNFDFFKKYEKNFNFEIKMLPINSTCEISRIFYDGFIMERHIKTDNLDIMFSPIYSKTFFKKNYSWVTVIHDFQPLYFPNYFSFFKRKWLEFGWKNALKTSNVIVISEAVKKDLSRKLKFLKKQNIHRIYNPIDDLVVLNNNNINFEILSTKYGIIKNNFYYTVSSLAPHKNLETLLKMMTSLSNEKKLVISGVGNKVELELKLKELNIEEKVVVTGYISDEERNMLYANCEVFLFPTKFEGFGMPVIEALKLRKRVIVSDIEILREITYNEIEYVKNYEDPQEWIDIINKEFNIKKSTRDWTDYNIEFITTEYINCFRKIIKDNRKER